MAFDAQNTKQMIEDGKAVLGIEFGSTRIKAILINEKNEPVASGSHDWENRYDHGSGPIRWRISGQDCRTVTGA